MGSATVAYTDPQGVLARHEALLEKYLGVLVSLHWQPSAPEDPRLAPAASRLRTIPALRLMFEPEQNGRRAHHQVPGLTPLPLLQVLAFEVTSLEIYRSKLRQIGKDWFARHVDVREATGFAVVLVRLPGDSEKAAKAIWTRMLAEFDEDNCVQLNPEAPGDWQALRQLLQRQLLAAFDQRVAQLLDEARKLAATKNVPGWNFGALFAVYESLAWAYESLNLFDDATRVYDALLTMVADVSVDSWPPQPKTLHAGFAGDRGMLVELMLRQDAARFDVLRHITARKVGLLMAAAAARRQLTDAAASLADKCVGDSVELALAQLPALVGALRASAGRTAALQWALVAARELYRMVDAAGGATLAAGKARVLLVERDALQSLAAVNGWTVPGIFNDVQLVEADESDAAATTVSRASPGAVSAGLGPRDLQADRSKSDSEPQADAELPADSDAAVDSPKLEIAGVPSEEAFRERFCELTRECAQLFATAQLTRAVARLNEQLVVIYFHQNDVSQAWRVFAQVDLLHAKQPRPALRILEIALQCAEQLKLDESLLDLSYAVLERDARASFPLARRAAQYVSSLAGSRACQHDLALWFAPEVRPFVKADADGFYLELLLRPRPGLVELSFDAIELQAQSLDEALVFTSRQAVAVGGSTVEPIRLYTTTFVAGPIVLSRLEARLEQQTFVHALADTSVLMRPLAGTFLAELRVARASAIPRRSIEIALSSPVHIERAVVRVVPCEPVSFDLEDQEFEHTDFTSASRAIAATGQAGSQEFAVECVYDGKVYKFRQTLDFTLDVSVDFQEHFRQPPQVYLQFLVQPFASHPIVFCGCEVSDSRHGILDTQFGAEHRARELLAFKDAPVSYLFRLCQRPNADSQSDESRLLLKYRTVVDECRHLVRAALAALAPLELAMYAPALDGVAAGVSELVDVTAYVVNKQLVLAAERVDEVVARSFAGLDPAAAEQALQLTRRALEHDFSGPHDWSEVDRSIEIGIPSPEADFIHYVSLDLARAGSQFVVGEAIPATLRIDTVALVKCDFEFSYELDRLSEGWSYTGRSRGVFTTASVAEEITLVPNRSGDLPLPNVLVRPLHVKPRTAPIVVAKHTNTKVLVVPETNMLAITF